MITHETDHPCSVKGRSWDIDSNISLIQGNIWQCNCIVVRKGRSAIAGDAFWNPADVETFAELIAGYDTHLLITHGDIDHCSCIGRCPDAEVVGSVATASRIRSGAAGRDLVGESAKWQLTFKGAPRIDIEVRPPETLKLGEWTVRTVATAGHAVDGTAYLIQDEGVFLVGDYLMASQHPLVWWSLKEAYRATERLLETMAEFDCEWVVPGHGAVLTRSEAETVGSQDLEYFAAVERVADEAQRLKYSSREWHLAVESVRTPRPCAPDIEMLCPRLLNAAATFRDRGIDGKLPWIIDMA